MQKTAVAVGVLAALFSFSTRAQQFDSLGCDTNINNPTESIIVNGTVGSMDINIDVKDLTINKSGKDENSVYAFGAVKIKTVDDFTINHRGPGGNGIFLDNESSNATFVADVGDKLIINADSGWAVHNENVGQITLKAKEFEINSTSQGITNNGSGKVSVSADNIQINSGNKHGVISLGQGGIDLIVNKDISIIHNGNVTGGGAVLNQKGDIKISAKGNTVVKGDIINLAGATGAINISFNGPRSSLTGAVIKENESTNKGTTSLGFSHGSQWIVTGDSRVSELHLDHATIKPNGNAITVDDINGQGTVLMDAGAKEIGSLTVLNPHSKASLTVDMVQNADDVSEALAKKIMTSIRGGDLLATGYVKEGLINGATVFDRTGKILYVAPNTIMKNTLELASVGSLSINRILMNDIRKRMGELRTSEDAPGVWVRYDGGKLSGNDDLSNEFNTVQVGADTMAGPVRLGLAANYTKGDLGSHRGSGDMKAYGLSAYSLWAADSGLFADVVARMAHVKNDMTIDHSFNGKLNNRVWSLSTETGWHLNMTETIFVEPQLEATYTYISSDYMTLTDRVSSAKYSVDSVNSFIGRAGVVAGIQCPDDKGSLYVRASAVHEFLGDSKITGMSANRISTQQLDGQDTWVEFGLGGNFQLTKQSNVWADVERTNGAVLNKDWRATVGVRYNF